MSKDYYTLIKEHLKEYVVDYKEFWIRTLQSDDIDLAIVTERGVEHIYAETIQAAYSKILIKHQEKNTGDLL